MMDKNYYIYKVTNIITNKIYIGQRTCTINPIKDNNYLGSGVKLRSSKKKHGIENFVKEILEICTKETLDEREIFWIKELDSMNPEIGYNLVEGGRYGISGFKGLIPWNKDMKMSDEFKKKDSDSHLGIPNLKARGLKRSVQSVKNISKSLIGRNSPRKGVTVLEETKLKISVSLTGRIESKETRDKKSIAFTGRIQTDEWIEKRVKKFRGRKNTEEQIQNIKDSFTEDVRLKLSFSANNLPIKKCPHCGFESKSNGIYRWHFGNCKYKQQIA
jgi:group I intron endonuclease